MSNNTELQKTEHEKATLERLSENRSFDISLKIFAGVVGMVTILEKIFVLSIPFKFIGDISAVLFVLAGLALYFLSLRPRNKRLVAENEFLKAESKVNQKEIEECLAKIISIQNAYDHIYKEADDCNEKLNKNFRLIKLAEEQRENIDSYVILKRFFWYKQIRKPTPKMYVGVEIENKSFFDITFAGKIAGRIEFDSQLLKDRAIEFYSLPDIISSMSRKTLTIEYGLSNEEIDHIDTIRKKEFDWIKDGNPLIYYFRVDQLVLTIKGIEEFQGIKPKPLIINSNTIVINADKYDEAQHQFK